jgi:hypothetical protein
MQDGVQLCANLLAAHTVGAKLTSPASLGNLPPTKYYKKMAANEIFKSFQTVN